MKELIIIILTFYLTLSKSFTLASNCDVESGQFCSRVFSDDEEINFGREFDQRPAQGSNNLSHRNHLNTEDGSKAKKSNKITQPEFCGKSLFADGSRIVGGTDASQGQFPWNCQIWARKKINSNFEFICGGTLINEKVIVTAAHCIRHKNMKRYLVKIGSRFIKDDGSQDPAGHAFEYEVEKLTVHPEFNKRHLSNDIALLWVKSKFNQTVFFTDNVLPICLPPSSTEEFYSPGTVGVASGWGLTDENGKKATNILQHVSLPVLPWQNCFNSYGKFVDMNNDIQFCAGNDKGQDACAGDSGGPYIVKKSGRNFLIGIVSFGRGCARPEFPGVYTRVQKYIGWIGNQLKKEKSGDIDKEDPSIKIRPVIAQPITTTTPPPLKLTVKSSTPYCKEEFKLLRCGKGEVIRVQDASYALDTPGHCGPPIHNNEVNCSLENAQAIPKFRCNNRPACWVFHGLFHTDPCPGERKYAIVNYTCE